MSKKLPRISGKEVIRVFRKDGWIVDRIEGSHYIMIKEGKEAALSIPVHRGKIIRIGLLKGLIRDAEMTNQEFLDIFYGK